MTSGKEFELRFVSTADVSGIRDATGAVEELNKAASGDKLSEFEAELAGKFDALKAKLQGASEEAEKVGETVQAAGAKGGASMTDLAGNIGKVAGVVGVAVAGAKMFYDAWSERAPQAAAALDGLWATIKTGLGDVAAGLGPAEAGVKSWADSWTLALGGTTKGMADWLNTEEGYMKKAAAAAKTGSDAIAEELEKQRDAYQAVREEIEANAAAVERESDAAAKLASADAEVNRAAIQADFTLSADQKAGKIAEIDAQEAQRKDDAERMKLERQRAVEADKAALAKSEQDAAAEEVRKQEEKVRAIERAKAADALAKAAEESVAIDAAASGSFDAGFRGDMTGFRTAGESRNSAAVLRGKADAARMALGEFGGAGSLEDEKAKLEALKKEREAVEQRAGKAAKAAGGKVSEIDAELTLREELRKRREDAASFRRDAAQTAAVEKAQGGGGGEVAAAASEAKSAMESGATQSAQSMSELTTAIQTGFAKMESANAAATAAAARAAQTADRALAAAMRALEAASGSTQTARFK